MIERTYSGNTVPAGLNYALDTDIQLSQYNIHTVEDADFIVNPILNNCNDVKINNYSCLFVTSPQSLSTNIIIDSNNLPELFSTTLRSNDGYLYVGDDNMLYYSSTYSNNNIFQIEFSKDLIYCSIYYYNLETKTKLYIDYDNELLLTDVAKQWVYYIEENNLTISINNYLVTFNIQPLYKNIELTNANMKYANASGGILSSYENMENNMLVNIQYSNLTDDTFPCNILTFNNQNTYTNKTGYANYWDTNNFRNIKNIQSGIHQEHGNNQLYTINEFFVTDYIIKPGINAIATPDTLYPYEKLNINDTTFIKSGAFGSTNPATSDKIYTKRYKEQDNNILLCTWLSANANGEGVWLDRYYNPTLFTEAEALSTKADTVIFDTYEQNRRLYNDGFYDQQSSVVLEPSQELQYYHITNDDFIHYIDRLEAISFNDIVFCNKSGTNLFTAPSCVLHNDVYGKVQIPIKLNSQNNFAVSFDVDMFDVDSAEILDIASTQLNNSGFRLYKKNQFTFVVMLFEYISTSDETLISFYNTEFEKIDEYAINGEAKNIYKTDNLTYFIAQFKNSVRLYNIFGGLLYEFSNNKEVHSCYCDNDYVYIVYKIDDTSGELYKYDILNFNQTDTVKVISFTNSSNQIICENNQIFSTSLTSECYEYIPNFGLMYLTTLTSKSEIPQQYSALMLNSNIDSEIILSNADTNYIDLRSNQYTDPNTNITTWYTHGITDFSANNTTLYCVTTSLLLTSDLDRDNLQKFTIPVHTSGKNDMVYVYTTNEIKNNKYVNNVYIILESDTSNASELYKFENGNFILKNTIYNIKQKRNKHKLTGKKYLKSFDHTLYFNITLKTNSNKLIKFEQPVIDILPGKHTYLINMDCDHGICDLYIDDKLYNTIEFKDERGKIYPATFTYSILQNQILFGNTALYNGGTISSYLKTSDYLLNDTTIENVYIFNTILSNEDIRLNVLKSKVTPEIVLNLPCGQRNELVKIEQIYKQTVPGHKSNHFDLILKNLQLSEHHAIKLSSVIKQFIDEQLPAATKLDNILYKNY